jgi:hypothetical protein
MANALGVWVTRGYVALYHASQSHFSFEDAVTKKTISDLFANEAIFLYVHRLSSIKIRQNVNQLQNISDTHTPPPPPSSSTNSPPQTIRTLRRSIEKA